MNTLIKGIALGVIVSYCQISDAQPDKSKSNNSMNAMKKSNKEIVLYFYNEILNNRKTELINNIVSEDYKNDLGAGVEFFKKGVFQLLKSFPDIQWEIEDVVGEDDKVFVRQKITGTHKEIFQDIQPTGRAINVSGFAIYRFNDSKIINHTVVTDGITFLQQLGKLPFPQAQSSSDSSVTLVDRFLVPSNSINEFRTQTSTNLAIVSRQEGFIKRQVYERTNEKGDLEYITLVEWRNAEALNKAKEAVQPEFKAIGFDPTTFFNRLKIELDRSVFKKSN